MRFLIRCDMEGITGVTTYDEVLPGKPCYEASRDLLMGDLLAVIEGLRRGDPYHEVVLYDEHVDGRNVRLDRLPGHCRAIVGKPRYRADWVGGLNDGSHALLMVGFHAMAGTPGATLPHTYEPDILTLDVNGRRVGEVGLEAALAGEQGIPLVLYAGDSAGAAEVEALIEGVVTVAVKRSLAETAAECLSPLDSAELLRAAGQQVGRGANWPRPLDLGRPVELRLRLQRNEYLAAFERLHGPLVHDDQVVIRRDTLAEAWADYWRFKIATQEALANA